MGEIKTKLNISKITAKNLFLVILLMAVMAVIGIIAKSVGSGATNMNTAQAQSCWTPPPVTPPGGGGEGSDSDGSESSGSSEASDAMSSEG